MKKVMAFIAGFTLLFSSLVFAQKQGGTLAGPIITTAFVNNFNPYTQQETRNPARGFMYEPMVVYNVRANKIDYRLATGFKYSDDLMSITYTLRQGVKWSDGKPFTADDVVFSHEIAKKDPKVDNFALWTGDTPRLKSVEKIDDHNVKFNLTKKDSTVEWFIPMHFIVPKHIWSSVKDLSAFKNETPVGTGPLTQIKTFKPQQLTICRNPNYWQEGRPYIDCLRFRQYQGNDQIQAALIRGEIDWGSNFIADIEKTYVKRDPKNNHFWYPPSSPVAIHLNTTMKPFDDLKFRQAFSHAINRPEIVDLATYGYASINPHMTGIGDYFKAWYNDGVNEKYDHLNKFDPDMAKKLLDEAGYKDSDGDGIRENKDGSPIKFDIMVVNGWTDWVQSVQMITEYLKEVGVEARTRTVEWGQYVDNWQQQKFQAGILWGDNGVTPYRYYDQLLHSRNKGQMFQSNHGFNSPEIDAVIDKYANTNDEAEQRDIINQMQEVVAQNLMIIPLFSNPQWYQYSTKRFDGWPTKDNPYVDPNFYAAGERVILVTNLYKK